MIHNLNALCYAGVIYAETDVAITHIFHSLTFFPNCIGTRSPYRQEITVSTVWTTMMYFCLGTRMPRHSAGGEGMSYVRVMYFVLFFLVFFFLMNKNLFANMYMYCKRKIKVYTWYQG